MRPIYLKFASESEWLALSADDKYAALTPVVLGQLAKPPVVEGAEPTVITGCHVNMLGEIPKELEQYEVFPVTPSCVFGGWSPVEIAARQAKA